MEELFNGQLSFADIEAEKFLQIRRTHADRRVNAMDRLTDDLRKLFKSTLNNRLHRNLACVIDKSSRGAKLKRAFEELP